MIGNADSGYGWGNDALLIENGTSCYMQLGGQYNAGTIGASGTAYAYGGNDTIVAGSSSAVYTPSPNDVISAAPGATGLHLELDSTGDIGYAVNPGNTILDVGQYRYGGRCRGSTARSSSPAPATRSPPERRPRGHSPAQATFWLRRASST